MSNSIVNYVGDGATNLFSVPYGYISQTHVTGYINGVATTLTWNSSTSVSFPSAPALAAVVLIQRVTPAGALVTFTDGSNLTGANLNLSETQAIYLAQEASDYASLISLAGDGSLNVNGRRLTNLATPTASTDATTKAYVDAVATGTLITPLPIASGGTGQSTAAAAKVALLALSYSQANGSAILPVGTTAQRDGAPSFGYLRGNSSLNKVEFYNGASWSGVGGATGGGADSVFYENDQTVTTDYTLTAGKNAMSAGTITIATGVTVTVPTGAIWSIV